MASWLTYLRERFPLPTYLLLVGGLSLSGLFAAGGDFRWSSFLVSFTGLMGFFAVLRLMDEVKDYEKDRIAHPERPLPRGVVSVADARRVVVYAMIGMLFYGGVVFLNNAVAGLLFMAIAAYLWLMYKEFYTSGWLADRPVLYGMTHQLILILLCLFAVATTRPHAVGTRSAWGFGIAVLGSFFSYEVCRKLDPKAHPVLKTYLSIYKPWGTAFLVLCTSLIAFVGVWLVHLGPLLWPFQGLLIVTLSLLIVSPKRFKFVEGASGLSLLAHFWGLVIRHATGWPS